MDFHTELHRFSGAADLIVARAGATGIAEFAVQAKPCIFVPGAHLTGGQQVHNANIVEAAHAGVVVQEDDSNSLRHAIHHLIDSPKKRTELSTNLNKLSISDSAHKIADILLEIAQ